MGDPVADAIRAFAADAGSPGRLPGGATALLAVGWATVELDRAIGHLAAALGVPAAAFAEGTGSAALGAQCRVVGQPVVDGLRLAVLEPSTEGRLAAALARWDEGLLVAWYATTDTGDDVRGAPTPGPFGPERLVPGDPLTGPHRLLVPGRAGTIAA